jgi:hypothetical protein
MRAGRRAVAQFRQKLLLGKPQTPSSFNALEILHGRRASDHVRVALLEQADFPVEGPKAGNR